MDIPYFVYESPIDGHLHFFQFCYEKMFGHRLSFLLDRFLGLELLGCMISLKVYLFILRQRQREQGRGRGRRRERIPCQLHAVSAEPDAGLEPTNCEIMI